MDPTLKFAKGQVIAERYELGDVIGQGNFGIVYRAHDRQSDEDVAVKFLLTERLKGDPELARLEIKRFERELELTKSLDHPNIVRTRDFGYLETGNIYSIMDYVPGHSLKEVIHGNNPLPSASETLGFMKELLRALAHAHERGVVHRDLKPENILVVGDKDRRRVMLLDFGIATLSGDARDEDYQSYTPEGMMAMTPAYAAPELFYELDPNAMVTSLVPNAKLDVYAWGLIFIECLTGEKVVADEGIMEAIHRHIDPVPFEVPAIVRAHPIGAVVRKAIAKNPLARYRSAGDVLSDLEPLSFDGGRRDTHQGLTATGRARNPMLLVVGLVAVVAVLVTVLMLL